MNIKSAEDVIRVARERGFDVQIRPGPPPMPVLYRPHKSDKSLATPVLLDALKAWRLEIIDILSKEKL